MPALEELQTHLTTFRSAPFLFVGSGIARRYLGLETWVGLLQRFAQLTGKPYAYFVTSGDGELPRIAERIAEAFHDVWWTDPRFESSRGDAVDLVTNRESPLKVEIARHVDEAMSRIPSSGDLADELDALRHAVVDGVITTNYDRLLEHVFPDFHPYVGQEELLFADSQGVGEIYKIHGSASRPDSLVLTRADYERFHDRNPYLAAKLLTVFVEHPVLFLGYSLSDPNITEILVSVARVLTTSNLASLQDRLIFVQWDADCREPTFVRSAIAIQGFTIPVVSVVVGEFKGLFDVLAQLPRKFPARLLRRLKEHVYDLVLNNDPQSQLFVQDIDAETSSREIDVVFGVGMAERLSERGYVGLGRRDLLLDVLAPSSTFNARRIVQDALPQILRQAGNTPVYRYLREAGLLKADGTLRADADVDDRVRQRVVLGKTPLLLPRSSIPRAERVVANAGGDFPRLITGASTTDALAAIAVMNPDDLNREALQSFLIGHRGDLDGPAPLPTAWARAVCLFDYYVFGVQVL